MMNSQTSDCPAATTTRKMDFKSINEFFMKIGELKSLERAGWVIRKIDKPETVSGHQYRMAIMAMILFSDETNVDVNKVIKLALIHDMSECLVGDITPYDNVSQEEKHQKEMDAIRTLSKLLPAESGSLLVKMFEEYEDRETPESKLTKQLDVFDAVLQAFEYEKKDNEKNGLLQVDNNHFFDPGYLSKIEHPKLKALLDQLLRDRNDFLSQSGGDLEKADDVARIILNMLKICDTSSFITELNSNWINIIFNTYYYSIRNLNKQTVILKKHMHKQYYEQQLAV